jgi:hypothetical protein
MSKNIEDFLLAKNEVRNKVKTAKAQEIQNEKDFKEHKEATFQPKTITFEHKLDHYKPQSGDRGHDLYNKVKKNQFTVKHDKTLAEYELEKGFQECTHNPVIN